MAVSNVKRPEVVKYGAATEKRFTYLDAATIVMGDLIRVSTAGTVEVATASSAGAVRGMALEDGTTGGDSISVLLFAPDTVVALSAIDAVAPTSLKKGVSYTLEIGTNAFGVTATTTNGVALITDYPATGQPWLDRTGTYSNDITAVGGTVFVRFSAETLDGAAAA